MSRFVIRRDGRSYTADSEEELVSWAQGGRIARSDLIHVNDGAGWRKASDIDFLAGFGLWCSQDHKISSMVDIGCVNPGS